MPTSFLECSDELDGWFYIEPYHRYDNKQACTDQAETGKIAFNREAAVDRIWLQSYQEGVPAEIELDEFQSVGELFEKSVALYRDRVAYINMGAKITYGELDTLSRDFAAYLQNGLKLPAGAQSEYKPVKVVQEDLAFLQYTGGTTGVSKGAMLTHRNILANATQAYAWVKSVITLDSELVVTALPLYHIFALTANCLLFIKVGASNLLITNPRDIPGFVAELGKYPFTVLTGVNTLFNALLHNENFAKLDFSKVKVTLGGGAAVQRAVAERWKKVTGHPLIEAYGLTETSPAACINPINLPEFNGTIGLPISSTDCAIRNDS